MGNCQAIDNATLLIQHPNGGRVDKLYWPVTASEIMKMNPGHYVALLLTTTTLSPPSNSASSTAVTATKNNIPVRITRIKLLKPTDTLVLGHVYRLITTQEVMKGLWAKKYAKMKQQQVESGEMKQQTTTEKSTLHSNKNGLRRSETDNSKQVKQEKQRNSTGAKPRAWHPKLHSISEATS